MDQPLAKKQPDLRTLLASETFKRQIAAALPQTMSPERFARIAITATFRNPKLLNCTQESFLNCLMQLGAIGIEPDGRRAHLIPYGDVCTLIIDYKGIAELLRRNGDVAAIHCDVVGKNDHFEIRYGTRGILDHIPNIADRGPIYCAYSWVKLPDGTEEYDVMGLQEIESIRKRSKTPDDGPWASDFNEMAKKTVFRRHSKTLPLSPATREALDRDSDADALTDQERFAAAKPLNAVVAGSEAPARRRPGRPPKLEADLAKAASEEKTEAPPPPAAAPAETPLGPQVRALVTQAGFSEEELLALMKRLRMAQSEATKLEDCTPAHLTMLIEQWDTALLRLREARAKTNPPPEKLL